MTHTFQFGAANEPPVLGWTIVLLYPSFQDEESWRLIEKAAVIREASRIGKATGVEHPISESRRGLGRQALSFQTIQSSFSYARGLLTTNTVLW